MPSREKKSRNSVFISYSHADSEWLTRLRVHLRPLERDLAIEIWDDTRIASGSKWRVEIERALAEAKVAILMISADFLASDFIHNNELPPLLKAAEENGALILPVIVSPSRYLRTEGLKDFQSVNPPSSPLIKMPKSGQEEIFVELTEHIETAMATNFSSNVRRGGRGHHDAARAVLNRVPLILYYEDIGEAEAQVIYGNLLSKGMRPNLFGPGVGNAGEKTIVYSPEYKVAAEWLCAHEKKVNAFTVVPITGEDPYEGIIINLW